MDPLLRLGLFPGADPAHRHLRLGTVPCEHVLLHGAVQSLEVVLMHGPLLFTEPFQCFPDPFLFAEPFSLTGPFRLTEPF